MYNIIQRCIIDCVSHFNQEQISELKNYLNESLYDADYFVEKLAKRNAIEKVNKSDSKDNKIQTVAKNNAFSAKLSKLSQQKHFIEKIVELTYRDSQLKSYNLLGVFVQTMPDPFKSSKDLIDRLKQLDNTQWEKLKEFITSSSKSESKDEFVLNLRNYVTNKVASGLTKRERNVCAARISQYTKDNRFLRFLHDVIDAGEVESLNQTEVSSLTSDDTSIESFSATLDIDNFSEIFNEPQDLSSLSKVSDLDQKFLDTYSELELFYQMRDKNIDELMNNLTKLVEEKTASKIDEVNIKEAELWAEKIKSEDPKKRKLNNVFSSTDGSITNEEKWQKKAKQNNIETLKHK